MPGDLTGFPAAGLEQLNPGRQALLERASLRSSRGFSTPAHPAYADGALGNDREGARHLPAVKLQDRPHGRGFLVIRQAGEPQQPDAVCREALTKHQLTEVLVGCERYGVTIEGELQHLWVGHSRGHLCHVHDGQAVFPEGGDDLRVNSLVGDEVHAT